jgi:NADH dehydrogenase
MILLTGGTGLLGGHIVEELRAAKHDMRVLTMGGGDWRSNALSNLKQMGVDAVVGSMLNPRVVAGALEGCNVVINAAGGLLPSRDMSHRDIHVNGVKILCEQAAKLGVQRLIHISCLGADEHSDCEYFRCKWEGEQIVKSSQSYWTILRPSYIFGERCDFINLLKPLLKVPFIVPVLGSGLNHLQPVSVQDVALCAVQSIFKKETANQVIDLVGPKAYTLSDLMELLRKEMRVLKPVVPVTLNTALKVIKPIERLLPRNCINTEFVQMAIADSASESTLMKEFFEVRAASLEEYLQRILFQDARGSS